MQKWTYKSLIRGPYHSARMSIAEMNSQGADGWELVQILYPDSDGDTNLEYIFKKIKEG